MCGIVFFYKVPFVDNENNAFVVAHDERKNVKVLLFDALRSVEHKYANVAALNSADGAEDRIELQVLVYLLFSAQSGGVDKVEVESEEVVVRKQ